MTEAIEVFEAQNLTERVAEAKVMRAHCYWNKGEIEESVALLKVVEAEFEENLTHPVYLKICINRLLTLIWKKDYDAALKIIEKKFPLLSSIAEICVWW